MQSTHPLAIADLRFFLFLIALSMAAFNAGISFEQNSIASTFEEGCYLDAEYLEFRTGINFTEDLRHRDCNEIKWLWEKAV